MNVAENVDAIGVAVVRLSRDSLPQLIEGVKNPDGCGSSHWNVVEALEVLFDAAQFVLARDLARSVRSLLKHDGRERLFRAYEALSGIVIDGEFTRNLEQIEGVAREIYSLGHSHSDRVRITLIRSRAIGIGVAMKRLPETEILVARSLLEREFLMARADEKNELALLAGLELVKTYIYAPTPEFVAAQALLEQMTTAVSSKDIPSDLRCDFVRLRYQSEAVRGLASARSLITPDWLRREVADCGGTARALAELSIARVGGAAVNRDELERGLLIFEESGHCAAACETALLLAGEGNSRDHFTRAQRFFSLALHSARDGGSLYVGMVSLLGLFQSAWASGSIGEANLVIKQAAQLAKTELGLTAFGLNLSAAYQLMSQNERGLQLAKRCRAAFKKYHSLSGLEQAAFMIAGCLAGMGDWTGAADYQRRSAGLARAQRQMLVACEREIAAVEATLMRYATRAETLPHPEKLACELELNRVSGELVLYAGDQDALVVVAKVEHLRSQISLAVGETVEGLRHLSSARELYMKLESHRDVALMDASSGVAMLELARRQGGVMFDEAATTLHRAVSFFDAVKCPELAWKVRFHLARGALLRSELENGLSAKIMWREVALSWFEVAQRDREAVLQSQDGGRSPRSGYEFHPSLSFEALDELKVSLASPRRSKEVSKAKSTKKRRELRRRDHLH